MSATFRQLPATLNLIVKSGSSLSTEIVLGSLVGRTVSSRIFSLVDARGILDIPTAVTSETAGRVVITLSTAQASEIPPATYGWEQQVSGVGIVRAGICEFIP
jgi:hypothetical protein